MGKTDKYLFPIYKNIIQPVGNTALLGFTNYDCFRGDLYDLSFGNWEINSKWKLYQKYNTIISLRCPYFAKNPMDVFNQCYDNLNKGGHLYIDWGLGDHFSFKNYKIGWVKEGEHESCYNNNNYVWSTVWDDSFLENEEFKLFSKRVEKLGYTDIKQAIFDEVPSVLKLKDIKNLFDVKVYIKTFWEELPQIYFILDCEKK